MNISRALLIAVALFAGSATAFKAEAASLSGTASAIITAQPAHAHAGAAPQALTQNEVIAYVGKSKAEVTSLEPLGNSPLQLFVFLDDSTRSGALGPRMNELKQFVNSLPASTQVAIGYMRNGGYDLTQGFTTDHNKAANSIRLPQAIAGVNGSPYFALSYLAKHWPSQEQTDRRAVLMLTDGVDRYYGNATNDDPYVDAAIKDCQHLGILAYSIYLRGEGLYSTGGWGLNMSQSRLGEVAKATGGEFYYQGFNTPVSLTPYLQELSDRLNNQYRVTFTAAKNSGLQKVEFKSELPNVKIIAPEQVTVKGS
jgi:hypothetical protein